MMRPSQNGWLPYIDFVDVVGTHKQVVARCKSLPMLYLVRHDAFTRSGREIHRVYVLDKNIAEKIRQWKSYSPLLATLATLATH
jgi:hypothetical protein